MDARAELTAALPDGVVTTDPEAVEKYRFDWSRDSSAGIPVAVGARPDAVLLVLAALRDALAPHVTRLPGIG